MLRFLNRISHTYILEILFICGASTAQSYALCKSIAVNQKLPGHKFIVTGILYPIKEQNVLEIFIYCNLNNRKVFYH